MSSSLAAPQAGRESDATVVGVDLGLKQLVAVAPASAGPDVDDAVIVDGGVEWALFDGLGDTLDRLDALDSETPVLKERAIKQFQALLEQRFAVACATVREYADQLDADVVALEALERDPRPLVESARGAADADKWLFPAFKHRLETALTAAGYRVEHVDAEYTTRQCHVCGDLATKRRATIQCTTDGCPVDVVCRDRSAAVSIAKRAGGGR